MHVWGWLGFQLPFHPGTFTGADQRPRHDSSFGGGAFLHQHPKIPVDPNRPDFVSNRYRSMAWRWDTIHMLRGGSEVARQNRERWLPREEGESVKAYERRLRRSFLHMALDDAITRITARPFSQPVKPIGDVPAEMEVFATDADGEGRSLTQFASDLFDISQTYGMAHVLVDFEQTDPSGARVFSIADRDALRARPFWRIVPPPNLLGVQTQKINGRIWITQARIFERFLEPQGSYGDGWVEQIRVINVRTFEIWQRRPGTNFSEWRLVQEGQHTFGRVPLYTMYLDQTGFLESLPPHDKLAQKNVEHWQKASDQNNILHIARVPLLFGRGFSDDTSKDPLLLGSNSFKVVSDPNADLKWVEIQGGSIEAGREDLRDLELEMKVMGLEPLLSGSANQRATGQVIGEQQQLARAQKWSRIEEEFFPQLYQATGRWLDIDVPAEGEDRVGVNIFNDFSILSRSGQELLQLIEARKNGIIDARTFLEEIQRRDLISENKSLDDVLAALEQEREEKQEIAQQVPTPGNRNPDALPEPPETPREEEPGGGGAAA